VEEHRDSKATIGYETATPSSIGVYSYSVSELQNLQAKLGQALGTLSSNNNPIVFTPGVKLSFTECVNTPISTGGLDQGIFVV
jgi:hypothetical protein